MASIEFFAQDISFKVPQSRRTKAWIKEVIQKEKKQLAHINYIFCSDIYLLSINEQYLKHKTLTDIITFDNGETFDGIEGDIFISVERVQSNAEALNVDFESELSRVMVHGILHLIGYKDKTPPQKALMRKKEDAYLSLRNKL